MDQPSANPLRIGDWTIHPTTGQITRGLEALRLEARSLRLLLCLAERAPSVVSIDELLTQVWPDVAVSQDSVYQAVASLRRQLGDDSRQPVYIATVPRLGYQMVAPVSTLPDSIPAEPAPSTTQASANSSLSSLSLRRGSFLFIVVFIVLGAVVVLALLNRVPTPNKTAATPPAAPARPQQSIAVLPFLDLTPGMKEEEFADGMTEELIDKLARLPGLHVSSPTSSFYFKGKQLPVADIARSLGVVYILDGSVRKDGTWIRVATRLVRADSSYVLWSETYDRPAHDRLMIQDDIATAVAKALTGAIASAPGPNEPR